VSASIPSSDLPNHGEEDPEGNEARARAAAALQAAFTRLAPIGSDVWNFLGAFTHLGDRYGPYQPGASALSRELADRGAPPGGRLGRLRRGAKAEEPGTSELEDAMGWVVEAFRFLSARVSTLEERLAREDRPVEGAAWLVPAQELGGLVEAIVRRLTARTLGAPVVHGDCGHGDLLVALAAAGVTAQGVEPRGAVALHALERGCDVAICELVEDLSARPDGSLGGLVLSGVVDRMPLHALLALLAQARRVLELNAPIVLVTDDPETSTRDRSSAGRDLSEGRSLSVDAWEVLLERAGFVGDAPLVVAGDRRRILTAAAPS
jgi:hypothetical protein